MEEKEENWKPISGYEGLYSISSKGRVYSYYTDKILSPGKTLDGYPYVFLTKNKVKKIHLIHRLVATAFIPNPYNYPIINHKDEDTSNYSIDNLEWCDYSYNNLYSDIGNKNTKHLRKKVYQYDLDGNLIDTFDSLRECSRKLKLSSGNISSCCRNNINSYNNYFWSYTELSKEDILDRQLKLKNRANIKNSKLTSKRVYEYDMEGNFIREYPSVQEVAREKGYSPSLIAGVCRKEHKYTHGRIYRYANDCSDMNKAV